jgi:hypothetical protein
MSDVQIADSWQQRGLVLSQAHRLQQFAIADWLAQGIEQLGATSAYDYAETVFPQYARATFQSWVTVAKHFAPSIRIESEWLTFGHYQVAQGAERDPWRPDTDESEIQVARELVWIRQADERRMSVSALREAIAHAYELRREAFFDDHPESKPVEPEPERIPDSKPKQKDAFGAELKELKTPWLPKRARWSLDELARARRVTTEELLNRVIQDFLDAHSDEIGDAKAAATKREGEHDAQLAAAASVGKLQAAINQKAYDESHPGWRERRDEQLRLDEQYRQRRDEREKAEIEAAVFGTESEVLS